MGSRQRPLDQVEHIFDAFLELRRVETENEPFLVQVYPESFQKNEEIINAVKAMAYPCRPVTSSHQMVDHYTLVTTDSKSLHTFVFCRISGKADAIFCILSPLRWDSVFGALLDKLYDLLRMNESLANDLLSKVYNHFMPPPGQEILLNIGPSNSHIFKFTVPNTEKLPVIIADRNLTEFYIRMTPGADNMLKVWASMLFERRIMFVGKTFGAVSKSILGAESLLYPMHWQHPLITLLWESGDGLRFANMPIPSLVGMTSNLFQKALELHGQSMLEDLVLVNLETKEVTTPFDDVSCIPDDVRRRLRKNLLSLEASIRTDDSLARTFIRALVCLMGSYREALVYSSDKIDFDQERFVQTRPLSMKPFMDRIIHSQLFSEFIDSRLDMLNNQIGFNDEFEHETSQWHDKSSASSQYKEWLANAKKRGIKVRREGQKLRTKVSEKMANAFSGVSAALPAAVSYSRQGRVRIGDTIDDNAASSAESANEDSEDESGNTVHGYKEFTNADVVNDMKPISPHADTCTLRYSHISMSLANDPDILAAATADSHHFQTGPDLIRLSSEDSFSEQFTTPNQTAKTVNVDTFEDDFNHLLKIAEASDKQAASQSQQLSDDDELLDIWTATTCASTPDIEVSRHKFCPTNPFAKSPKSDFLFSANQNLPRASAMSGFGQDAFATPISETTTGNISHQEQKVNPAPHSTPHMLPPPPVNPHGRLSPNREITFAQNQPPASTSIPNLSANASHTAKDPFSSSNFDSFGSNSLQNLERHTWGETDTSGVTRAVKSKRSPTTTWYMENNNEPAVRPVTVDDDLMLTGTEDLSVVDMFDPIKK